MKLKVQSLMDSTLLVSQFIREQRPMPQLGKFRLARMHAKLLPEFQTINGQRDAMIRAYGVRQTVQTTDPVTGEVTVSEGPEYVVPADKMPEFTAAWSEIAAQDIEVDVEPIAVGDLDSGDSDGSIQAAELIVLGELIRE